MKTTMLILSYLLTGNNVSQSHLDINIDIDSDNSNTHPLTPIATQPADKPYVKEFLRYMDGDNELNEGNKKNGVPRQLVVS